VSVDEEGDFSGDQFPDGNSLQLEGEERPERNLVQMFKKRLFVTHAETLAFFPA
jgi:hypothetical protein